mmetsp:Transcript_8058/g.29924  ORF Transcript_8058/g.29924 Transcript_8058/m.29924 type:complete len:162 (-) Transcript_8058:1036-1521(-)
MPSQKRKAHDDFSPSNVYSPSSTADFSYLSPYASTPFTEEFDMRITHSLPPSLDKAHSFPTHEMMIATPADEASTDHYFLRGTVESPPRKRQKCCDDSASVFTGMDEWFSLSAGVSTCSVAANTGAQFFTDYSAAQKQSTFEEPQKNTTHLRSIIGERGDY